ncbi:MAG: DMT family transporter [Bacteroidota bacterium]
MTQNAKAHIANGVSTLLFGLNYWIAKGLMPDYFSPMQIIFFRTAGATLFFFVISMFFKNAKIESNDHLKIAIAALFGISINQAMFFVGLNLSTPIETSIIHASSPILVVVFATYLLKESFSIRKIIGLMLGAIGAFILILWGKDFSLGSKGLLGNIFILTNISAYALYLVLIKPLMQKYKPINVIRWTFFYGFIFVIPFIAYPTTQISFSNIPFDKILSLVYVVIATTIITYLLTMYSLTKLSASVVGYYIYMQPLIVAIIGLWLSAEQITAYKVVAAILIFFGVYLVSKKSNNQ